MEWNKKQRKTAVAAILLGVGAIAVTTVVMAAGGGMGGPGGGGPGGGGVAAAEKSASVITVKLALPTVGSITRETEFVGKIQAADTVSVYPETSGKVAKLYFDEGDYVNEGDLLLELDTADLEFSMQEAEASYASSVASYESAIISANKTLGSDYTSKIISAENSVEQAQNTYRSARLKYKQDIDSEDDNIDRLMEVMDNAKEAMEKALDLFNSSKSTATEEEYEALRQDYYEKQEKYNLAADAYSDALDDYDDETSTLATSKNNAYKELVKAQNQLDLTTGDAYTEQKAVTEAQLKSEKLKLEASQLSLEKAQRNLDKARLYSPVSGKIVTRAAEKYAAVSNNTAAFTIKNDESVELAFNASADGAAALNVGDELTVTKNGETYRAAVTKIDDEADGSSGLFPITAILEDSAGLLPGVTVKVSATTAKAENALTVPLDNVYYDGDQPYVFLYSNEDGKARRADLATGMSNEETIVVTDGIDSNSLVITTWHPDLADGVSVVLGEGMTDLVDEAVSMTARPASSYAAADTAKTAPTEKTVKAAAKKGSADSKEDEADRADGEETETLLYSGWDGGDSYDSFGIELPEDPVYPDTPALKDLSPPYVGNTGAASDAIAKSIASGSSGGGILNKK